ncbi:hypothetical protein SAMN04487891_11095 [Flagellimonas taeanensis]|uniref:Lipoprotein n=1 Tax=Flagellimonas taeanensis TaxID=1005926 RepID=A0A1M7BBJ9_9FLAO|nr:hypothetical protein [Allomuricauda taeanensis]SFC39290.1 hypothetical protein SAMN04487891_11095 [Allomuricauda taeanensis]SHL52408.1 hypothetical protein SAMN05216293_3656 [Allomuricauda taeanensis]
MKKVIFSTVIAMTLLASCNQPKKKETAPKAQESMDKVNNAEMIRREDSIKMAKEKTLDSLEQVKSHGHAH